MNQDLDDRLIPPGQYRSAQNVAISRSQGEDVGALENIEGNNIITNSSLSSYENLDVIGYYVDPSENNVYYFLTDYVDSSNNGIDNFAPSSANCFIYRFNNTGNGTFTKLVEGHPVVSMLPVCSSSAITPNYPPYNFTTVRLAHYLVVSFPKSDFL